MSTEWYYEKNGEQSGPVSLQQLNELLASGGIETRNLVWKAGMADWLPYSDVFPSGSAPVTSGGKQNCPSCGALVAPSELIPAGATQVCPYCREQYAQRLKEGLSQPMRVGARGTGGMTPNYELRSMARMTLAGCWGTAALVTFLCWFLQQVPSAIPMIGSVIVWIIAGPLTLGAAAYFLGLVRGENVEVGTLFNGFSRFGFALGLYIVTTLIISLAALAAAIPGGILIGVAFLQNSAAPEESPLFILGVIAAALPAVVVSIYMSLRYAMVYFIGNDNQELGVFEVVRRSVQMMDGRKGKFFSLALSFIGWHLLGVLAFLVGLIWSCSYMYTAVATFYDDLGEDA